MLEPNFIKAKRYYSDKFSHRGDEENIDMKVYVCDRGIKEDASEALNQEVLYDRSWEETRSDGLNIL